MSLCLANISTLPMDSFKSPTHLLLIRPKGSTLGQSFKRWQQIAKLWLFCLGGSRATTTTTSTPSSGLCLGVSSRTTTITTTIPFTGPCLGDSVTSCGADYKVGSSAGDLHPSSFSRDLTSTYPSFSISASSAPSLFPTSYSQNLQDCNARRAVEEVEKTRQRLPGTSVMSPSSCSHLRLLIARDASLIAASYGLREVHTHTDQPTKAFGDSRQSTSSANKLNLTLILLCPRGSVHNSVRHILALSASN